MNLDFGKKVGKTLYIHVSGVYQLPTQTREVVRKAARLAHKRDRLFYFEVVKIQGKLNFPFQKQNSSIQAV